MLECHWMEGDYDAGSLEPLEVTGYRDHDNDGKGSGTSRYDDGLNQEIDWSSPLIQDASESDILAAKNYMAKLNSNLPGNFWINIGVSGATVFVGNLANNLRLGQLPQAAALNAAASTGVTVLGVNSVTLKNAINQTNEQIKQDNIESRWNNKGGHNG